MRSSLMWSMWSNLTRSIRMRSAQCGLIRGWVLVENDNSGGWVLYAYVDGEQTTAYVPGVVSWREAERCAARYLRRLMGAVGAL